jgi:hypothetical protein
MRKYFYLSVLILFLFSCRSNTKSGTTISDSLSRNDYSVKDTPQTQKINNVSPVPVANINDFSKIDSNTYSFSFGDDGSEGSDGKVYYENGKIKKITFIAFGETGQYRMTYTFLKNGSILLCEKDFSYPRGIDSVLTEKDMHLDIDTCFSIDYEGKKIGSVEKDSTFMGVGYLAEIKKIVPFALPK